MGKKCGIFVSEKIIRAKSVERNVKYDKNVIKETAARIKGEENDTRDSGKKWQMC